MMIIGINKILFVPILFFCLLNGVTHDPIIDVVIPCHEKDQLLLPLVIESIKRNGVGIRNVYVISKTPFQSGGIWIDELSFPFTKDDIAAVIAKKFQKSFHAIRSHERLGWIYQQLLKLYSPFVIPNISPFILLADADIIFLKKIQFIDDDGKMLLTIGREYHEPYFLHAKRILPELRRVLPRCSGITHHMIIHQIVIEALFYKIRSLHHKEPWEVLVENIDPENFDGSSMSEYEIYFNFVQLYFPELIRLRNIRWLDFPGALGKHIDMFRKKKSKTFMVCHQYKI